MTAQPPAIVPSGIVNAASKNPPKSALGAIARGSRFEISGVRFGEATSKIKVSLTQSPSLAVPLISTKSYQIEALMPAEAPLGKLGVAVTRDGEPSKVNFVRVVRSNFGIFTANSAGWGPARFGSGSGINFATPARPGGKVTISGTGLGDEAHPKMFVAGRPARVLHVTRNPLGMDEITFGVPPDAPEGCFVPVYATSASAPVGARWVSNPATIPIAKKGPCKSPAYWPLMPVAPSQTVGTILFTRQIELANPSKYITDRGFATFFKAGGDTPLVSPLHLLPPPGSCIFSAGFFEAETLASGIFLLASSNVTNVDPVDAGPLLEIARTGLERIFQPRPGATGVYSGLLGSSGDSRHSLPLFLEPGRFSVSSEGGQAIGRFTVSLESPANFTWLHYESIRVVDRRRGVNLEWKTLPAAHRAIMFAIAVDRDSRSAGMCVCLAAEGATHFFVGPDVFAGFPAVENNTTALPAFLGLGVMGAEPQSIRADGMDKGIAASIVLQARRVGFR